MYARWFYIRSSTFSEDQGVRGDKRAVAREIGAVAGGIIRKPHVLKDAALEQSL